MATDMRSLRTRIKSIDSTMHLTKAMGLVASSKLRRATENAQKSEEYASALAAVTEELLSCPECSKSPYLRVSETDRTRLIVIAGDRGLAGGYNANIFRLVRNYPDAEIIPVGKRACDRYEKDKLFAEMFTAADAHALAKKLCADFVNGEYDILGIVGTRYVSVLKQEPYIRFILPLTKSKNKKNPSAIFEPDESTILETAIPEYVAGLITSAVREGFLCELASRRMAMDNADKNAEAMIEDLRLKYNRARQGAITQEITEIVAGSDA